MDYGEKEFNLKEYLWIIYKHRWPMLSFFIIVVFSTVIYNIIAEPVYRASTRILIEKENPNIVDFKEIYAIDTTSQEFYQTQYKILESRFIAKEVIDKLNLWVHEEFVSRRSNGKRKAESNDEMTEMAGVRERIISRFLNKLNISPVRNTRIVIVSFLSKDPKVAAMVANAVVKAYMEYSISTEVQANIGASGFLREKIKEQRGKLEESELLLKDYKEKYNIVSLEDEEKITVQKLAELSSDITRVENARIESEVKYRKSAEMMKDPKQAGSIPDVMTNAFIRQLKADEAVLDEKLSEISKKYGPKHPDVIALNEKIRTVHGKISDEIRKVVHALKSEYESALEKETALKAEIVALREESQKLGKHAVEYNVLERDVQMNKQMYEVLLKRMKETNITGGIQTTNVRILDPAVPPVSSFRPRRMLNIILALIVGLLGSPALAISLDYLDNSIKTPEDIKRYLEIPYLGALPEFELYTNGTEKERSVLVAKNDPKSFSAEAYRSLRTSIVFSSPETRKTLLVTSSNPSEGKSVTSLNLAITMAQNGSRTLLVDMDFRRPAQHRFLSVSQDKGLSNLLVGDAELDDIIVRTDIHGLDFVPSGHIPPNPAELLSSNELKGYINIFRERYDRVIFDSPPILSATDPVIISTFADEVLLVINVGEVSRELVLAAIGKLKHVKANLLGTVLNRVKARQGAYYYNYGYYNEDKQDDSVGLAGRLNRLYSMLERRIGSR